MTGAADGPDLTRVVALRRASLERAGFDPEAAEQLAVATDIPLQDVLSLVKAGFPPDVALGMLTSGDRPVF